MLLVAVGNHAGVRVHIRERLRDLGPAKQTSKMPLVMTELRDLLERMCVFHATSIAR